KLLVGCAGRGYTGVDSIAVAELPLRRPMQQTTAVTSPPRTRTPVKREGAERYILISLTCFGLTVAVTRVYLEWSDYPQIGNAELHIAHALWGGLLLFLSILLTLIVANRWALSLSAVL